MLFVALACAASPEAAFPVLPPSSKPAAPCAHLHSELWSRAAAPDLVEVAVDLDGDPVLPAELQVEERTERAARGRLPGTALCTLAAVPGVTMVRVPFTPSPK